VEFSDIKRLTGTAKGHHQIYADMATAMSQGSVPSQIGRKLPLCTWLQGYVSALKLYDHGVGQSYLEGAMQDQEAVQYLPLPSKD